MQEHHLKILGVTVIGGDSSYSPAQLTGKSGKAAQQVLSPLLERGWIEKRAKKYAVTDEGKACWERETTSEEKAQIFADAIAAFVQIVEAKHGKKLTKADLSKQSPEVQQRATNEGHVLPGAKAGFFLLTSKGMQFLLSRLPADELLLRIQESLKEMSGLWSAANDRVQEDYRKIGIQIEDYRVEAKERMAELRAGLSTEFQELGQLAGGSRLIEQTLQRVAEIGDSRLQKCKTLHSKTEFAREELAEQRLEVDEKLEEMKKTLDARLGDAPVAPSVNSASAIPAEEDISTATMDAYHEIHRRNKRTGGIVNVPELYDEVRRTQPTLPRKRFDALLLKWQRTDEVVLQVCNDPHYEPRIEEGIDSPRGRLFYVQLN